ncbi:hypothetical protein [Rhodopila sp.]|jgi:hypothetical protein|uniref:hypothetical protein n=1 Tax=Rhodopila sp. TaxID=2480087 RepID=UPI002BE999CF|nr:hypothetical protein [Rhodopila sp.]HVZ08877.1 hypothetical protein [Rhodopila sp.]
MVTVAEAHDVAVLPPWYAPAPRKVAIHRYLDANFVAQFQADAASSPQSNTALFSWEQEDRMPATQGGLLKLRRPIHRTFHVVAWEASCKLPMSPAGQPAIAPEKIASAGFVVRTGTAAAPQGFQIVKSKPQGWGAVEPGVDPDAARQVKALGLVPRAATPAPGYTGEETFPLHPLLVQDSDRPHTLLYGYLPIGGGDFVPPGAPATPTATDDYLMDLPWPFGLAGYSNGPPSQYTADQQITDGQIRSPMAALLRVLLGRYQLADSNAWTDPQNAPLIQILDGLSFYDAPPMHRTGALLRVWAAANQVPGGTLGAVLRAYAARSANGSLTQADQLLASLVQADPTSNSVTLPPTGTLPGNGRNLLVTETQAQQLRAALRLRAAQLAAVSTASVPVPKLASGPAGRYFLVPFVRTVCPNGCERIFWGAASDPFAVAAAFDPDAARPSLIEMPSLADARKGAARGAAFDMPPDLADLVNGLSNNAATQNMMSGSGGPSGGLGIRFLCSFSLPVITICAMIMLSVIINLLNIFLGWMAWVKICLPLPSKK